MTHNVLTYEEYAKIEHDVPYIYEMRGGENALLYFGAGHSYKVDDPQFVQLEKLYEEFKPEVVVIESVAGIDERPEVLEKVSRQSKAEAIVRYGESGLAMKLAVEDGLKVACPEPRVSEQIDYCVKRGISRDGVFAMHMYQVVNQYHRQKPKVAVQEYMMPYLDEFVEEVKGLEGWGDYPVTLDQMVLVGRKFWGDDDPLSTYDPARDDPVRWDFEGRVWTEVNEASLFDSFFRDQMIVEGILRLFDQYKRVFVVYGASHAYMQRPAFKEFFG